MNVPEESQSTKAFSDALHGVLDGYDVPKLRDLAAKATALADDMVNRMGHSEDGT